MLDLDALVAAALAQHYGIEPGRTMRALFPESRSAPLGKPLIPA